MNKQIHGRLFLGLIICSIFFLQPLNGLCENSTEIIRIEFRKASELLPFFEGMLSDGAKVSIDTRTNSIVVTDDRNRLEEIKSLIKKLDTPPQQVKVRVKFIENMLNSNRSIGGKGSISGDNYKINIGKQKRDGFSARAYSRDTQKNQRSEYFIIVSSGSPAYIKAGENIIYRDRWNDLLEKYTRNHVQITIQQIDTGFDVTPVLIGNRANIEIIPRISYKENGARRNTIRFTEAVTTISVPLNQWVTIGSTNKHNNEVIKEILGYGASNSSSALSISLMVEK